MPDIADQVDECHAWARAHDREIDTDALTLLLRIHRDECHRLEPVHWTESDVETVTEKLIDAAEMTADSAEQMIATWLTWCDFIVETGLLAPPCSSPRTLRAAIQDAAEGIHDFVADPGAYGTTRALLTAAAAEGIDLNDEKAVTAWLNRLSKSPDRLAQLVRAGAAAENPRDAFQTVAEEAMAGVPPIRLVPVAELAAVARKCAPLQAAKQIALWVGAGRPLAEEHDGLTAEDAATAAADLGVPREELPWRFDTAVDAGFLRLTYTEVLPGPALADWPDGEDAAVLRVWAAGLDSATQEPEFPPLTAVLLTQLVTSDMAALSRDELAGPLAEMFDVAEEILTAGLERLAAYGAVDLGDDQIRVTPLSDYALVERLRQSGQGIDVLPDAAELGPAELLAAAATARLADIEPLADDWFATRDPIVAAGELLTVSAPPEAYGARSLAATMIRRLGPAAAPIWRDRLEHPTLGDYARVALTELGEEPAEPTDEGHRIRVFWRLLDSWATVIERGDPHTVTDLLETMGEQAAQLMEVIWRLGHPAAAEVLAAIGAHSSDKKIAKAARRAAFKLKSAR